MSNVELFDIEGSYKKSYTWIFSFFYLWEGVHQAIPAILPYYLLFVFGVYDIALLAFIGFIALLPWSLKFLVGILNDKWGSPKWGRRFPFILVFGCLAGFTWISMTVLLPLDERIYSHLVFYLLIANIGMAVADTSLDGMILDVVPKDRLAKVQGYTWSMLMLGGAGAAALGLAFYYLKIVPLIFLLTGVFIVITSVLAYKVKEPPVKEDLKIGRDLKRLISKRTNWKVFIWTFIIAIAYPCIIGAFMYLMFISMGIIDISETTLSLEIGQTTELYILYNIFISGAIGIGIIIGSIVLGRIADKSRKFAIISIYALYLPFCLLSMLFLGFIGGLIANIIFGFIYGAITIVGQTIRGDIAKKRFPDLKSTYYAILISFSNLGQSFGSLILAFMYAQIAPILLNFYVLYLIIALLCTGIVFVSYLTFRTIDPDDYEFEYNLTSEKRITIVES